MGVELAVVLEQPQRAYRPLEELRGVVRVTADAATRCEGLDVYVRWYTDHPVIAGSRGTVVAVRLFEGELAAGTRDHPFVIALPLQVAEVRGYEMTMAWHVEARAHLPLAIDPEASARLRLQAPDPWGCRIFFQHEPEDTTGARAALRISAVGLALGVAALVAAAIFASGDGRILGLGMGAAMTLTLGVLTARNAALVAGAARFGPVRVTLQRTLRGADPATIGVRLGKGKVAHEVVAAFKVEEFVKSGGDSSTSRSAYTPLCEPLVTALRALDGGNRFEGPVPLPIGMPYSVHNDGAGFRWHLAIRVRGADGKRWDRDLPIAIHPFYPDEDPVVEPRE